MSDEEYVIFNRIKVIENFMVIDGRYLFLFPRKLRKFFLLIENITDVFQNILKCRYQEMRWMDGLRRVEPLLIEAELLHAMQVLLQVCKHLEGELLIC
jgi:hypothetical protein